MISYHVVPISSQKGVLFLRHPVFQSAKKCEMTSFCMTLLHADLNEAAKCVDIIPLTLLASLSHLRTLVQNAKWRRYLA